MESDKRGEGPATASGKDAHPSLSEVKLAGSVWRLCQRYGVEVPAWVEAARLYAAQHPRQYTLREVLPVIRHLEIGPGPPWDLWVEPNTLEFLVVSREQPVASHAVTFRDGGRDVTFYRLNEPRLDRLRELWSGAAVLAVERLRDAIKQYMPELAK